MNRPYSLKELDRLNREVLSPLEGLAVEVQHQVLLAGLLGSLQRLELITGEPLPAHLVALKVACEAVYRPLVAALREGPYAGMPVA